MVFFYYLNIFRFLKNCGTHLTHLSLGKCDFIQQKSLDRIALCQELVGNYFNFLQNLLTELNTTIKLYSDKF